MNASGHCSLILATGYHSRACPLWEGRVDTGNLHLQVIPFRSDGECHRRFLEGEFDAAEFSLALYLVLKSRGAPLEAIPIFPNRKFRHSYVFVREDSALNEPAQLKGKAVGIPRYLNTCGLWVRGFLGDEYGVRVQDILWKALKNDPVAVSPPQGTRLELLSGEAGLYSRLLGGEVDAIVVPDIPQGDGVRRLLLRSKEIEQDYYRRTQIFPTSHAVVIRKSFLENNPSAAAELFRAWSEAKRLALEDDEDPTYSNFAWVREAWEEQQEVLGADPWRYGIKGNENVLKTLIRYAAQQGLLEREISLENFFIRMDEV